MKLVSLSIVGFEAFSASGTIRFQSGTNVIIGQNNAGKTSILRALLPDLRDNRHRKPGSFQYERLAQPAVTITLYVDGSELHERLFWMGTTELPVDPNSTLEQIRFQLLEHPHTVSVVNRPGVGFEPPVPSLVETQPAYQNFVTIVQSKDSQLVFSPIQGGNDTTGRLLHSLWSEKVFYVSAERVNPGYSLLEINPRLASDGRNLAAVLLKLHGERGDVFEILVNQVRQIFSSVGNISVRVTSGLNISGPVAEIRIWPTTTRHEFDLSFPLAESGTGVAQVLLVLTAVITTYSSVILIDEVSSFLHPSATKSLLRILSSYYDSHQFLLTTHSSEVLNFSLARSLHLVKRSGYVSSVQELNPSGIQDLRSVADDLGVSMADVFAADKIIWVEGPTEEICFPFLYESSGKFIPQGTKLVSIVATGDFTSNKRSRELVIKIYERLASTSEIIAVTSKFHFDKEQLSETEMADAQRRSSGKITFLPRRNFECYLINPEAIHDFLLVRDSEEKKDYTVTTIESCITNLASNKFHVPEWKGDIRDPTWLREVDGAALIKNVCENVSDARVVFQKKVDALALLKYIHQNNTDQIAELMVYAKALIEL